MDPTFRLTRTAPSLVGSCHVTDVKHGDVLEGVCCVPE